VALTVQSAIVSLILTDAFFGLTASRWLGLISGPNGASTETALVYAAGTIGGLLVALAVVVVVSWRLQSNSWRRILAGYCVLAAMLAYLAHDEPTFRRPVTLEEIAPAFPGADTSYNVLMQYGKEHPLGQSFKAPSFKTSYPTMFPDKPDEWRRTIRSHEAEFKAHWEDLAAARTWWSQLDGFDRIGDLTRANWDSEIVSFEVFRAITLNGSAIASLQALEGHGDEAIDTLLPILSVGRKLQPSSRYMIRQMLGIIVEDNSIMTASFILDNATVSPAARARLSAALQGGGPEPDVRRLFATDYAIQLGWMSDARAGDVLKANSHLLGDDPSLIAFFNLASPFIYNIRASLNAKGDLFAELEELSAKRQLDQLEVRTKQFIADQSRPGIKNLFGRFIAAETVPGYKNVVGRYWQLQDRRAALLARLAKP
jgi:hypothetical protein